MKSNNVVLGILGGMGPLASAEFLRDLLDRIPARKDWDYPRIILDSHPHIPSRSRCWLYNEPSPLSGMLEACRRLEQYGARYLAIPCNSAQCWLNELQEGLSVPILDIRQITVDTLRVSFPSVCAAIVFGSAVTLGTKSYLPYLERAGIRYIQPDEKLQGEVEAFIELAKSNTPQATLLSRFQDLLLSLSLRDDCAVILACTEFGLVRSAQDDLSFPLPIIDSFSAYAAECARLLTSPYLLDEAAQDLGHRS